MRYIPMLTLITLMSFFGCAKKFKADALPAKQLVFGTGGGFAGVEKRFILLENGQLFQQLGEATPKELQKMPKKVCKDIWAKTAKLELSRMAINEPGNTYQFLEVGEAAAKARMVWNPNAASTAAPQELLNLYESLMRATSTLPNNN